MHRILEANGRSCAVLGQTEWAYHHLRRICLGEDRQEWCQVRTGWHGWNPAKAAWRLASRHGVAVGIGLPLDRSATGQFIHAPRMVSLSRPVPNTMEDFVRGCTRSALGDLRRIKQGRFSWTWDRDLAALPEFLARFHYPSIRRRYGEEGFVLKAEDAASIRESRSHALLRIMQEGRWVGGILVEQLGEWLWMRQLGWLEGTDQQLRGGVIGAGYTASMERAIAMGTKRLVFGAADPFFEDGLLAYKAKWGGQLDADITTTLTLCWAFDPGHPEGRRFLHEHALIAWNADRRFVVYGARLPQWHSGHRIIARQLVCWYRLLDKPCPNAAQGNPELPVRLRPWFVREQIPVMPRPV